ncbi:MAG: hypothetical protein Q8M29_04150 [Bacteroidota bacterium]|nr:hypothetical protein [Bacteroidota bacterium]
MKSIPMKLRLLILSLFVVASFAVNAQDDAKAKAKKQKEESNKAATAELILGLPKASEKNLFILEEATQKINGLVMVQFCEGHKLGMFRYNKEIFATPEDVIKAFEKENVIMPMLIKEGTFKDLEEMCSTK